VSITQLSEEIELSPCFGLPGTGQSRSAARGREIPFALVVAPGNGHHWICGTWSARDDGNRRIALNSKQWLRYGLGRLRGVFRYQRCIVLVTGKRLEAMNCRGRRSCWFFFCACFDKGLKQKTQELMSRPPEAVAALFQPALERARKTTGVISFAGDPRSTLSISTSRSDGSGLRY
jgi:hypothetical protein